MEALGRYQLRGIAGKGAAGIVYRAYDPEHTRIVALKTIRTEAHSARHAEMLDQLKNEGRMAGVLHHPNIVSVLEAGEVSGHFYIAMEFVDGQTLAQILSRTPHIPTENVIHLACQLCDGLDYANSNGVIHRDVKPANIIITNPGSFASVPGCPFKAKLTDFGIADSYGTLAAERLLGTPYYMSPEHVKGKALDGRSDLFGLGVILYEMFTGEKPFDGKNVTSIIYKIVHDEPVHPREIDSRIHPGLNAVITKSLAKNPENRFQTGAEFASALKHYACWVERSKSLR